MRFPKRIAVDFTSILPGGENGGAKVFVIKLLSCLAELSPKTEFILLTHERSHEELATLECANVKRHIVFRMSSEKSVSSRNKKNIIKLVNLLPRWLSAMVYQGIFILLKLWRSCMFSSKSAEPNPLLKRLRVELLFCPFMAPTFYEVGIPTVCTVYDFQHKEYPKFFTQQEILMRDRAFLEASQRANFLVPISNYSRQFAINRLGIKEEMIHTVYLQMADRISSLHGKDESILNQLGLQPQKYLLYPANFWKHKNHEMLFTAFNIAIGEGLGEDIKLVCTGAPSERQTWLKQVVEMMQLKNRIIFPGYLENEQLSVLMANAAGLVFPSLYEGFGMPVIEAMAAGIPVACSNVTALPEVVGDAALMFDPRMPSDIAKAIHILLCDQAQRAKLIDAGKARVLKFSDSRKMAEQYWSLFNQALLSAPKEDMLSGFYKDGWASSCMNLHAVPKIGKRILKMRLFAPEWLPNNKISIKIMNENTCVMSSKVFRGASVLLELEIPSSGGVYAINIAPCFTPKKTSTQQQDSRVLSLLVEQFEIVDDSGAVHHLCSDSVYA